MHCRKLTGSNPHKGVSLQSNQVFVVLAQSQVDRMLISQVSTFQQALVASLIPERLDTRVAAWK